MCLKTEPTQKNGQKNWETHETAIGGMLFSDKPISLCAEIKCTSRPQRKRGNKNDDNTVHG